MTGLFRDAELLLFRLEEKDGADKAPDDQHGLRQMGIDQRQHPNPHRSVSAANYHIQMSYRRLSGSAARFSTPSRGDLVALIFEDDA